MSENRRLPTGTCFLLHEFINENGNSERVNSFSGDEEVIVIVNDESEKDESGHTGNDGEKSLDLWGLSPDPCSDGVDRRSLRPHDLI